MEKVVRLCSIDGCGRVHAARGWCSVHYKRWRRHGSTDALRGMTLVSKVCPHCGEDKPLDAFSPSRKHAGGVHFYCRPCSAAKRREYYARTATPATRAVAAKQARERRAADPAFAEADRARIRARAKAKPHVVNAYNRAWRASNPERARQHSKRYRDANPDKALQYVERRRARLVGAPVNDFTAEDWRALLVEFEFRCAYCLSRGVALQQDHMTPLSRGGSHTRSNVVPACGPCNNRKGTRDLLRSLEVLAA